MVARRRQLKFGVFLRCPGSHFAGWRHPDAVPETDMSFQHYIDMTRVAERGKMDCVFFQDSSAVVGSAGLNGGPTLRPRDGRHVHLEPVSLIAGLAAVTTHIGLVSTATTTYNEPYHIARRFATIDHMSGGRAGWNLVTSQQEDEAGNFGFDAHMEHKLRYERATEFFDVVAGLWDSWDADAFIHDKAAGIYFDVNKVHFLNHKGKHFSVRGPLNVSRSPQGRPIVSQAGSSEPGRELAARTADLIFTAQNVLQEGQAFYADVKSRADRYGRAPDDIKILPGLMPIIGRTDAEAREKLEELQSLLSDEVALVHLSRLTGGLDLYQYPLDGPLPDLPPSNAAQGRQKVLVELARRNNFSIRQLARHAAGASGGHQIVCGTPTSIADRMEEWLTNDACDGFNLLFPYFPSPLEEFVEQVIPELQRRGIYRTEYQGRTLRENLEVPMPRGPASL